VLSAAVLVLSAAVLVLSAAVLEVRESQTLLIHGSKQAGLNREFHRSNRPSLCSVIRAGAGIEVPLCGIIVDSLKSYRIQPTARLIQLVSFGSSSVFAT